MDRGLLSRQLCWRAFERLGLDNRRLQSPCPPWRFLVRRSRGPPRGLPRQWHRQLPEPQRRLPGGEDAYPLILIPFTAGVQGRPWSLPNRVSIAFFKFGNAGNSISVAYQSVVVAPPAYTRVL